MKVHVVIDVDVSTQVEAERVVDELLNAEEVVPQDYRWRIKRPKPPKGWQHNVPIENK